VKITRRQLRRIIKEAILCEQDGGVIEILFDRDFNTYKAPNGEQVRVNLNPGEGVVSAEDEIAAIQDLAASSGATHVNDDGTILTIDDMIAAITNDTGA